jgi:putative ABC transport system permease protein
VIGQNVKKDLFFDEDPIGKKIKYDDQNFTVIGVFEKKGSGGLGLSSQDDSIVIPLRTAQKLIMGIDHIASARFKVREAALVESAMANVKMTLRERHNIDDPVDDDFSVRNQAAAMEMVENVTDILRYFLLVIGAISLLVGGVGIMNIMLIAVSQRIREVGLRKAVGAKNTDVLTQFLVESVTISMLGGVMGIIIGVAFSFLISVVAKLLQYNWVFIVSWQSVVVATVVSMAIGIIFGLYPARKAAKISPMEALRYE